MSNVLKCDRCGKIYEYYSTRRYKIKAIETDANSISLTGSKPNGSSVGTRPLDLCPECMDKMVDFLEGRNDDKPKNKFKVKNLL